MSRILGVKFRDFGQIYYFDAGPYVVSQGDQVIVETEQGRGLARVALVKELPEDQERPDGLKTIFRLANDEDLSVVEENDKLAREAFSYCKKCIEERKLDMKLVDVEIFFDKSKMIFYFTAPGRVDFRELVKDLVRQYRTRIELRQIGVRHETQMLGAVGNCGQLCCCRRFMRKFDPVTIKMAKEQNLFLNPTKISGICGRLLCCLNFEQANYEQFQRRCPRIGRKYQTSLGQAKVLRSNFFRDSLTILPEVGEEREILVDEWEELVKNAPPPDETGGQPQDRGADAPSPQRGGQPRNQARNQQRNQPRNQAGNQAAKNDADQAGGQAEGQAGQQSSDQAEAPAQGGKKASPPQKGKGKPKSRGGRRPRRSRKKKTPGKGS